MKWLRTKLRLLNTDESGASFIIVTMALPAIFGMAAFAVDLGYMYYIKSRLQNAADLAALAASTEIITGNKDLVKAKAEEYFYLNIPDGWRGTGAITVFPEFEVECSPKLRDAGVTCFTEPGSDETINYIKVDASATAPLFFASALGFTTASLSAEAIVAGQGTTMPPLNVAIVLDTTGSMDNDMTSSCGDVELTKLECAKKGALEMVKSLWPTVDKVALYTYPGVSQGEGSMPDITTARANANKNICSSGTPTVANYIQDDTPSNYQIVPFSDNYRTKTEPPPPGALPDADLVKALGGSTRGQGYTKNCTGLQVGSPGIYTFFADAIRRAQADLDDENETLRTQKLAERQNVIVILSDGDANSPSFYEVRDTPGQFIDIIEDDRVAHQCGSAIEAAADSNEAKTWVYSIAYDAPTDPASSCLTDKTLVTKTVTGSKKTCDRDRNCSTTTISKTGLSPARNYPPQNQAPSTNGSSRDLSRCTRNCSAAVTTTTTTTATLTNPNTSISACSTMRSLASSPDKFFSISPPDSGGCVSESNPNTTDLMSIFKKVANSLTKKRRVPKAAL